ncbi:lipase family protein [Anthocerotibacter panamensis]|uniref:lipase family protein n=1 Tax=Anthocerotibacter panamensis TaxID=2857077 RepID=UPI001C402979|nr:Mbeg1-like protein [Anthocerotibacter panamensis]
MLKEASEQQPAKRLPASFKGTNLATEALFEQMAFMSYEDQKTPGLETARAKLLKQHGYTTGHFIVGLKGFQMRLYEPIPEGQEGHSPGLPAVLAFRGTEGDKVLEAEGRKDVEADFDPAGIGLLQYNANKPLIEENLRFAAQQGPVIVTGHSLGGALAQLTATEPKLQAMIKRVVTFASPGINRERIRTIEQYNQAHKSHEILSTHYRIKDKDMVPKGGEAWTEGLIHEFGMQSHQTDKLRFEAPFLGVVLGVGLEIGAGLLDAGLAHVSQPVTDAALAYDPSIFTGTPRDPQTTYQLFPVLMKRRFQCS